MRITTTLTDAAVLGELGARLRQHRLDANVSQATLAAQIGLGRRTVQRVEEGEDVSLSSLIRILRYHRMLDALDRLLAEPGPNPVALLEQQGTRRRRAGHRAKAPDTAAVPWGDEA